MSRTNLRSMDVDNEVDMPYEIAKDWLERNKVQPEKLEQIQLPMPEYQPSERPKAADPTVVIIQF